jgi:hypothetical protein
MVSAGVYMIDVKHAAKTAIEYVVDLLGPDNVLDARIEEVELSDDDADWLVTVGFFRPARIGLQIVPGMPRGDREFKQVRVRTSDGTVRGMRIRTA